MKGALIAVALLVSAPAAEAQSILSYKWTSDALVLDHGRAFTIYIHPKADTLLIQPRLSQVYGGRAKPQDWPLDYWRQAAEAFVEPIGCGISDVSVKSRIGATWQAVFVCPPGVDLRRLAADQHATLIKGEPLHP
jgi:hypothetical protein